EATLSGDVGSAEMAERLSFDRMRKSVDIGISILEADLASLSSPDHPQASVIRSSVTTNHATKAVIDVVEAYRLDGKQDISKELSALDPLIATYSKAIERGRKNQKVLLLELKIAKAQVQPSERPTVDKVIDLIEQYDDAWHVEDAYLESIETIRQELAATSDIEARELIVSEFFDLGGALETERERLIFERIAGMK
ncbi:MAG: hypothetical protein WA989_01035, partial [Henriciella sp.]|uniref:hypothetical protein n=1 Tax=Henriciella sp. TaxID=1968823 RepID=UPI003C763058